MSSGPSVQFTNAPALIRMELKERYPQWYANCLFRNEKSLEYCHSDLLILPASFLIQNVNAFKNRIIISFGPSELLEQSYLAGVSDFLKDPWNCQELIIRSQPFLADLKISFTNDTIDLKNGILLINEKFISLTPFQSRLIKILMKNKNTFLSYPLLEDLLGMKADQADKSLHVHIHNLRRILKAELPDLYGHALRIENSSSQGYALIFTCG